MREGRSISFLKCRSPRELLRVANLMIKDEFSVAYCIATKENPIRTLTNRRDSVNHNYEILKVWHGEHNLMSPPAVLPFLM